MNMKPRVWIGLGILVALAGCEGQTPFAFLDRPGETATAQGIPTEGGETIDVEAPEIFGVTDTGLWDGRPSLGGVWVAFPDVPEPERVIIRNTANGSSVIGALFRRERDNPGPRFQISSDAAEALNILAGEPTQINVVALTRDVAPAPAPDAETVDPTTAIAAAAIAEAELDEDTTDTAAAPPSPAPALAASSTLARPYIQIGIFNVAANAEATEAQMRAAGLAADTTTQESQGKTFYRVIVGPAPTETARDAALDTVRSLGFADAYFVTN
jgi:cell division septation protein DedD